MKLIEANNIYVFQCTYEEKFIAKEAGFKWNAKEKKWWTENYTNALKLSDYASSELIEQIERKLQEEKEQKERALEASRAIDAQIDIPCPEGFSYLPFQKAGIAYCLERFQAIQEGSNIKGSFHPKGVLIGDDMGLGKTFQAIGFINATDIKDILIICPATLKLNWRNELEKFMTRSLSVGIADSKCFCETDIVIMNYDIVHKYELELRKKTWDLIIADESHLLRNSNTIRSACILGGVLGKGKEQKSIAPIPTRFFLALSGTAIVNRHKDLWPILHGLDPFQWPKFWSFAKKFCGAYQTRYGWDLSGSTNGRELQEILRTRMMVRRKKEDVLPDLPKKRRQIIELSPNGAIQEIQAEQNAWKKNEERLEKLRTRLEIAKVSENSGEYKKAVEDLKEAVLVAFEEMSKLRHKTAVAKIPHAIEFIENCLEEEEEKIIIFAHHQDVINRIKNYFGSKAVVLTGKESLEEKQEAVDRFQNDPSCLLFIGSMRAAGLGITLTASSHEIFLEEDWTPAVISQCEDRAVRIGAVADFVLIQHLVFEESLDVKMAKTVVNKQEIIDRAFDDKNMSEEEAERELLIPVV